MARRLGARLGLPVCHIDTLFWKAGWEARSMEELAGLLEPVVAGERWVIDGNFAPTLGMRLARADTVVWLDYPARVYRWRVLKRQVTGRWGGRPDMAAGCRESFDLEFLRYAWAFERTGRPALVEALKGRPVTRLMSPREARSFLKRLK
jgi:adenylate kinase family enzyme